MRVSGCILFILVLVLGCNDDLTSLRYTAEDPLDLQTVATTQTSFRLEGINGEIRITGSSSAVGVTVTGYRRVNADSQEEADERLSDITVGLTSTQDEILLKTKHPKSGPGWNYIVDFTVEVPRGMAVSVLNGNGSVDLNDARGGVVVTVGNGGIQARNVLGDMKLTAGNGNISGHGTLLAGSMVRMDTGNGNAELRIPRTTSATVEAAVGNGVITVSGLLLLDREQNSSMLSGRLGTGDGTILIRAGNGNISLVGI